MPKEQGMSKRQQLREKRAREQQRGRWVSIVLIALGAVLMVGLVVYPNLKPVEFVEVEPKEYPQANMNTMGDPNAPVKLDVWEDFQCPACKNFSEDTDPLLIQNYVLTGKAFFTFHHFPFIDDRSDFKESDQAANASMCAAEQGKFWQFKELVFANWDGENQGAYSNRKLTTLAEFLSLDMGQFNQCFRDNKYKAQIDQDYQDGVDQGVQSTPSIFVDGTLVTNPQNEQWVPSYDNIAAAIEAALAK